MNPELQEMALKYSQGWDEAYLARGGIGVLALVILALVSRAVIRRNTGAIAVLLWAALAIGMATFAVIPSTVIQSIMQTDHMMRVRILMGCVSVIVLLITFESLRKTHLQERYALLWVTTALVMLMGCLFPDAVMLFRAVMGMSYDTAMAAVASIFLILVCFHFSISLSSLRSKQSDIAQKLAILAERVRELEKSDS